jgi:GTPase SAR1 family protein
MASASPLQAAALPKDAFRLVLFGMPGAGKSSLLGALAQAAQVQENILNGKLIDRSKGLMELKRGVYEGRQGETPEEVVPYPIALQPLAGRDGPGNAGVTQAVVFDCDGRAANELLTQQDALTGDLAQRALAQAVASADTLILCVDASAEAMQLKRDFSQFAHFLRMLEHSRGQRAEIGGLPVYLVLTKCDLLAQPSHTTAEWMDHIEERKRTVHQQFQEFLAQQAVRDQLPFGKIRLHVWATAAHRPALAGSPAKPKEPYGVAELFRQCLDSARQFRDRRWQATQRLGVVFALLGVLLAFMTLLGLFFLATQRETEIGRFEKDLRAFRAEHNETAADRLKPPRERTLKELQHFKSSPLFEPMPEDLRTYVYDHIKELEAYEQYTRKFREFSDKYNLPAAPRFARTDTELDRTAEALQLFPVPQEYKMAWNEARRRQEEWPKEIQAMRRHVSLAIDQFDKLQELADEYNTTEVEHLVKLAKKYGTNNERLVRQKILSAIRVVVDNCPYLSSKPEERIPNTAIAYGAILRFDRVASKYNAWKEERRRLPLEEK